MHSKNILLLTLVTVAAAAGGWFAARQDGMAASGSKTAPPLGPSSRKILYYQSPMHPWIKSDRPGNCTICGMKLAPVYEGEPGISPREDTVVLSETSLPVVHVETEEIKRGDLVRTVRVAGMIVDDPTRQRILSAYVDGRIEKLGDNYVGARIEAGQVMAVLYSPTLLNAEKEYVVLQQQLAETNLAPVVQQERQIWLDASAQRLRSLGLTDNQIAAVKPRVPADNLSEVRAPYAGVVISRNVFEGQYVKEGDRLFEMADLARLWFEFDVYERDLPWVRPGQEVEITTEANRGKTYHGRINFVDPSVNDSTRSAKARVELDNPRLLVNGVEQFELQRRLYAEGQIRIVQTNVLLIPRQAILNPGGTPRAYVALGQGAFQQRPLQLGRDGDRDAELLGGVSLGERVVSQGNLLIDAQAELNRSGRPLSHDSPPVNSTETLTEGEVQRAEAFFAAAAALAAALAADDLERYNRSASELQALFPNLARDFEAKEQWQPFLAKIQASAPLPTAVDLPAARRHFLSWSNASAAWARELRREKKFARFNIFQCPMVDLAIPGAEKNGFWVQTDKALRNPFFGAKMLDCGQELLP